MTRSWRDLTCFDCSCRPAGCNVQVVALLQAFIKFHIWFMYIRVIPKDCILAKFHFWNNFPLPSRLQFCELRSNSRQQTHSSSSSKLCAGDRQLLGHMTRSGMSSCDDGDGEQQLNRNCLVFYHSCQQQLFCSCRCWNIVSLLFSWKSVCQIFNNPLSQFIGTINKTRPCRNVFLWSF